MGLVRDWGLREEFKTMNVLFIQAGEYAAVYDRLKAGGPETYRDQRVSIDWVEKLSQSCSVTVLALGHPEYDDTQVSPTLRSVNVSYEHADKAWFRQFFEDARPDRIICRIPYYPALRVAKQLRIPTLANFADFFANDSLRQTYRNMRLRLALTGPHIPCVSNHNLNASKSVARALFFSKSRIVPWDRYMIEASYAAKAGIADKSVIRIFYAGMLGEAKGLADVFEAVAFLDSQGVKSKLSVAGPGDKAAWKARADTFGVGNSVSFLGRIPHSSVLEFMHAHDVVVVPSRWEYAEGLPNVLSEALAARTPLAISDHPAFADRLIDRQDCLIFPAGNPRALAKALKVLKDDTVLYKSLSENSPAAFQKLKFGLYWDQLWKLFLEDPVSKTGWVQKNSLAALLA